MWILRVTKFDWLSFKQSQCSISRSFISWQSAATLDTGLTATATRQCWKREDNLYTPNGMGFRYWLFAQQATGQPPEAMTVTTCQMQCSNAIDPSVHLAYGCQHHFSQPATYFTIYFQTTAVTVSMKWWRWNHCLIVFCCVIISGGATNYKCLGTSTHADCNFCSWVAVLFCLLSFHLDCRPHQHGKEERRHDPSSNIRMISSQPHLCRCLFAYSHCLLCRSQQ